MVAGDSSNIGVNPAARFRDVVWRDLSFDPNLKQNCWIKGLLSLPNVETFVPYYIRASFRDGFNKRQW
jgi:hypothetical protein